MANLKKVRVDVDKVVGQEKWGGTFFTAVDVTEAKADNKIKDLLKKHGTDKGKGHTKTVKDV